MDKGDVLQSDSPLGMVSVDLEERYAAFLGSQLLLCSHAYYDLLMHAHLAKPALFVCAQLICSCLGRLQPFD